MHNNNFKNDKRRTLDGWYITADGKEEGLLPDYPQDLDIKELHIAEGVYRVALVNIPDLKLHLPSTVTSISMDNCQIKSITLPEDAYFIKVGANTEITNLEKFARNRNVSIKFIGDPDNLDQFQTSESRDSLEDTTKKVKVYHISV